MRATVLVFILNLVALIIFGPVFAARISTGLLVFIPVAGYHALVFGLSWWWCRRQIVVSVLTKYHDELTIPQSDDLHNQSIYRVSQNHVAEHQ